MKIRCPKCRKSLPTRKDQSPNVSDVIQCGLCDHVWKLKAIKILKMVEDEEWSYSGGREKALKKKAAALLKALEVKR